MFIWTRDAASSSLTRSQNGARALISALVSSDDSGARAPRYYPALFPFLYSSNIPGHSSKSVHVGVSLECVCVKGLAAFCGPLED